MADNSKIEWTESTWNPITGCSVTSPGCTNCYAMRLAGTRLRNHPSRAGLTVDSKAGPVWTGEVRFNEKWLDQPLRWKRPRLIFVCAHGDLFHENVPDEWIDKVFAIMALAPHHTFQMLTKRADRMRDYLNDYDLNMRISVALGNMLDGDWVWKSGKRYRPEITRLIGAFMGEDVDDDGGFDYCPDPMPLPNVWIGVSVEDQTRADERIPLLLETPAAVRWISAEPLLAPLDLQSICTGYYFVDALRGYKYHDEGPAKEDCSGLDWVVVGGESGPGARPMHRDWARQIRDDCVAAGVPLHFKQWGAHDEHGNRVGKAVAGRSLDGVAHDGFPDVSAGTVTP